MRLPRQQRQPRRRPRPSKAKARAEAKEEAGFGKWLEQAFSTTLFDRSDSNTE